MLPLLCLASSSFFEVLLGFLRFFKGFLRVSGVFFAGGCCVGLTTPVALMVHFNQRGPVSSGPKAPCPSEALLPDQKKV